MTGIGGYITAVTKRAECAARKKGKIPDKRWPVSGVILQLLQRAQSAPTKKGVWLCRKEELSGTKICSSGCKLRARCTLISSKKDQLKCHDLADGVLKVLLESTVRSWIHRGQWKKSSMHFLRFSGIRKMMTPIISPPKNLKWWENLKKSLKRMSSQTKS